MACFYKNKNGVSIKFNDLSGSWKKRADKVKDITSLTSFMIDALSSNFEDFKKMRTHFFGNFSNQQVFYVLPNGITGNSLSCSSLSLASICDDDGGFEIDNELWVASMDSEFNKKFLTHNFPNLPEELVSRLVSYVADPSLFNKTDLWLNQIKIALKESEYDGGIWLKYKHKPYVPLYALCEILLDVDNDPDDFQTFFTVGEKTEDAQECQQKMSTTINVMPDIISNCINVTYAKKF